MKACLWIIKSIIGWWKVCVVDINICEQGRHCSRHALVFASHLQPYDEHGCKAEPNIFLRICTHTQTIPISNDLCPPIAWHASTDAHPCPPKSHGYGWAWVWAPNVGLCCKCIASRWLSLAKLKSSGGNGHTSPYCKGRFIFAQKWYGPSWFESPKMSLWWRKNVHKIFMFDDHLVVTVADFGLVKPFESMNINCCNTHLYKTLEHHFGGRLKYLIYRHWSKESAHAQESWCI